jgi:asparagine synthase (glutamine-hydrolysing)
MSGFIVTFPATQGAEHRRRPEGTQEDRATELQARVTGSPWWERPGLRPAEEPDPARRLLRAWGELGEKLLDSVRGHFAFVLTDPASGRLLMAVDRVGVGALAWARTGAGGLVAGTSAWEVARHPQVGARLADQALYDYMLLHMVPSPDTAFTGVRKLEPGCCVLLERGQLSERRYWKPAFARGGETPGPAMEQELLQLMQDGVSRALQPGQATGAFLSGGLDSSTVVGMFSQVAGGAVDAFTVGFPAEGYDEREYSRLAAAHFGARAHEFVVTPEHVAEALPLIAAAYDEPFGNSSAVPAYFCARFAREQGMAHLLAGDGGDELFGGNPHYSRQLVLETYHRLPAAVREALCEGLLLKLIPDGAPSPFGKARSYIEQARQPLPARLQSWNYMARHAPETIFSPEFLARIDTSHPWSQMARVYEDSAGEDLVNRLLTYDWHYVLADSDLRKVNRMCALAGIEVSYPMLDDALVDFSLRLPSRAKTTRSELRGFFKRATRDFLPQAIIEKEKHGFGLPFGVWLKTEPVLRELMQETLASLSGRGIFRPDFLHGIAEQHLQGHASYHGYVIWDLLMLEQWLSSHAA